LKIVKSHLRSSAATERGAIARKVRSGAFQAESDKAIKGLEFLVVDSNRNIAVGDRRCVVLKYTGESISQGVAFRDGQKSSDILRVAMPTPRLLERRN